MPRKKSPKQLDAEIAVALAKKPSEIVTRGASQATSERVRVKRVAAMMADLMGDDDWYRVDLDQLASWLDLGPSWNPTSYSTRELAETLIEQSVEPHHAGGPSKLDEENESRHATKSKSGPSLAERNLADAIEAVYNRKGSEDMTLAEACEAIRELGIEADDKTISAAIKTQIPDCF
jgi:hypothetical protein